jgi:hypothetical protein
MTCMSREDGPAHRRISRGRGLGPVAFLLAIVTLGWLFLAAPPAAADAVAPVQVDISKVIAELGNALSLGRQQTAQRLAGLGFAKELGDLQQLDGNVLQSFSSETMIETLFRRAQATSQTEGDRFLAKLIADAGKSSAAIATDPQLEPLRRFNAADLARPIIFAPLGSLDDAAIGKPLPAVAEKAIGVLAEHYSGGHLARAREVFLRNLQKPGFDSGKFEQALAHSPDSRKAIIRMLADGLPPPRLETALRNILHDAKESSAALGINPDALTVMDELSNELPPELERYSQVEDSIPSRQVQVAEAATAHEAGKINRSSELTDRAVLALLSTPANRAGPPPTSNGPGGGGPSKPNPFKPGPDGNAAAAAPPAPDPSPGGGGGGGAPAYAEAYTKYTSNTFEPIVPRSGPLPSARAPTPRGYGLAIRSASAARGIAIGGTVTSEIRSVPVRATWLTNSKDDRFGRLFVEFQDSSRQPIAASRVFFSDSFFAAKAALWDKHDAEATFRDGQILVLMSMDPDSSISRRGREGLEELDTKISALQARMKALHITGKQDLEKLSPEDLAGLLQMGREIKQLEGKAEQAPRGIVTHPAIFGRELAWSAARVDFWFNRIGDLSKEAAMINGAQEMPENLRNLNISAAGTWQFYELNSVVKLGGVEGKAQRLIVGSNSPGNHQENLRSHFGVSMFAFADHPPADGQLVEDGIYRLPKLENDLQPMLDWLSTNHPDFMRLNDFSEAFSLLRWLRSNAVVVNVVSATGEPPGIATPDRVVIGQGPSIGAR